MKNILTASEGMSHEYCASVIRVGELEPIEGSDFLVQTKIAGFNVVVRKDEVKTGDIMFYAANETMLDPDFVGANNLFDRSCYTMNANSAEVDELLEKKEFALSTGDNTAAGCIDAEIKGKLGFFNKYGRVKLIRLRKCPSYGFLFSVDAMAKYCPEIKDVDLESLIDNPSGIYDFDTVNGKLFIKVYMLPEKEPHHTGTGMTKKEKKLLRYNRIIPGEFKFHYDTQQLNKNMYAIKPTDVVTITNKIHGSSLIIGNILTNYIWYSKTGINVIDNALNWVYSKIPEKLKSKKKVYDVIYSSRTVIKNKYINNRGTGYYDVDIWSHWYNILKDYIPEGIMLYGEIFGYTGKNGKFIQTPYDYGCAVNENKVMFYRVVQDMPDGTKKEYNVSEVYDFTMDLINKHSELKDKIMPIEIFYHGTLKDLYPEVDTKEHWHENVLELLKNEKKFGMEQNEVHCRNKCPREGVVIRIDNDPVAEAYKLKCTKFLEKEGKDVTAGVVDIEAEQKY